MKIWDLQEDVNLYEHLTLEEGNSEKWNEFTEMFRGKRLNSIGKNLN